jgi:hypothetical protein
MSTVSEGQQVEDASPGVEVIKRTTQRKRERRELRVAFDTNVLFTGSASDLVRPEVANLISRSKFGDLDVQWYLPEVVRMERQYQMQKGALDLLTPLRKVEKLLGHNFGISEEALIERVEKIIAQHQGELGLIVLKPEYANLDWDRLVSDCVFRKAPFQEGKTEKGFRDALIVESFVRLVNESPKTPKRCRVVLVTADLLVIEAAKAHTVGAANALVLGSLEELGGLINTLVSEVDEAYIASLRPRADELFFVVGDESTLYYKEHVRERLERKFARELSALPSGATDRKNLTWQINPPNFSKKSGQHIYWASRIEIEVEARRTITDDRGAHFYRAAANRGVAVQSRETAILLNSLPSYLAPPIQTIGRATGGGLIGELTLGNAGIYDAGRDWESVAPSRGVVTHKGSDVYDVLWKVVVTRGGGLRRPSIDDIVHVDTNWEAVS